MGEKRMLEMEWAGDLKDAGDWGGFAEGGSDDESGTHVVSVNDVWKHVLDQGSAGLEYGGDLPGVFGGDVEIHGDYGGAYFLIFGGEAGGGGRQNDSYFEAQGAQDADLVIDPSGSGGGFDDVQDLHEKRAITVRSLMDTIKTIPQKVRGAECKGVSRLAKASLLQNERGQQES
jgi:hypothetical protein